MSRSVKPRQYDSTRRQEQARQTRRAVLEVALRLFVEQGYAATSIADVAARTGVSVETVYKAFGSKPELAKAVFDVAVVGDDEPIPMMEREAVQRNRAEPDPRKRLRMYGAHVASVTARVGPIQLVLRAAADVDAGAAGVWDQLQNERLTGMTHFAKDLHATGHLRPDVSVKEAADVLWTYNSAELWDLLVRQRGWAAKRYGRWIGHQLIAALL